MPVFAKDEVSDIVSGGRAYRREEEHAAIRRLLRRMVDVLPFTACIGAAELPTTDGDML